jgi:hypothetical protein
MYPLLFQETCSIEIITIGGLLGATLPPISFPFVPHHQGFWVFTYSNHNYTIIIFIPIFYQCLPQGSLDVSLGFGS